MKSISFVFISVWLSVLILISCKSKNPNQDILEKWDNKNPKIVKEYSNKAENSYAYSEYYRDGKLKTKEIYEKGKINGSAKYFDEEGYLIKEKQYKKGILDVEYTYKLGRLVGPEKVYHSNGQLWTERILLNGKPMEVVSNFDSTGKPMDPGTLKDGYGTIKLYDKKGNLVEIKNYRDGKEVINKEQNQSK
jgi:antitoxin component YwqK of YwqJK toxin-antitoxin module